MDYRPSNIKEIKQGYLPSRSEDLSEYILPISPACRESFEAKICQRFSRGLRESNSGRMSLKILAAIRTVAHELHCSEAHISKILVDYGLRAPRNSFPQSFLKHIDDAIHSQSYMSGVASYSYKDLFEHWHKVEGYGGINRAYSYAVDKSNYM